MWVSAVITCSFVFDSVPNQYKTQEMYDKAVDDYARILKFIPHQYQILPDKIVPKCCVPKCS